MGFPGIGNRMPSERVIGCSGMRTILDGQPKSCLEELTPWRFQQPSSRAA
jgi:hypothetical protein